MYNKHSYLVTKKITDDNFLDYRHLIDVRVPMEIFLQFIRKRLLNSKESWLKLQPVSHDYSLTIPKDSKLIDIKYNNENYQFCLILEHNTFDLVIPGSSNPSYILRTW